MHKIEKINLFTARFSPRQDVYGRAWESLSKEGKLIKGYAPVCDNFWADVCHIKKKDGKTCATCVNKKYTPVSDESVWRHISGEEAHTYYLLQQDGTVKFLAMDFDSKPHAPEKGYTFTDVKVVSDFLVSEGVPHGIARSTTNGFHLYVFLSDFYKAVKAKAIMFWIFERVGFFEQMRQGTRPIPEAFPKNNHPGFGIGNGIKPGMIEPQFAKERNGFVDGNGTFIPADHQWEWFKNIPDCTPKQLDGIIEKYGIEFEDTQEVEAGTGYRTGLISSQNSKKGSWQPPLTGSIEKVVEGCAALRAIVGKCKEGTAPSHQEGFSLFHIAMHTMDGLEWFKKTVPGWGQTDKDIRQLEHSLEKNYLPPSCAKLQEQGVCPHGKKCFDPKPPLVLVEGKYVIDESAPPANPSPIRYAFGKGEDFLEKLKAEVDTIAAETDENKRGNKLREIAKRAQVFDDDQQTALKDYIKSRKFFKAPEIKKVFSKAEGLHNKGLKDKVSQQSNTVRSGNNTYIISYDPPRYELLKHTKDGPENITLCDSVIEILESRTFVGDKEQPKRIFVGEFRSLTLSAKFKIDADCWSNDSCFLSTFTHIAGTAFSVTKNEIGYIRQASQAFSNKNIRNLDFVATQGWHSGNYLMPGRNVIHAENINNDLPKIDLQGKPHAENLCFQKLDDIDLDATLVHIKNDFLNTWPRLWTLIALSHALLPAVAELFQIHHRPTLFLEGPSSSGKTALVHGLQWFWGVFKTVINLCSTARGIESLAYDFKDAFLALDDFKGLTQTQVTAVLSTIQYSYDGTGRVALNKDSTYRETRQSRAVLAMTGEHFICNQASVLGRTILIQTTSQDHSKTHGLYTNHEKMREKYNGVTPEFIQYVMSIDATQLIADRNSLQNELSAQFGTQSNGSRFAESAAVNHFVWLLFVDFLKSRSIVNDIEAGALIAEHKAHLIAWSVNGIAECAAERIEQSFLDVLREALDSGSVVILPEENMEAANRPKIGFAKPDEPEIVFLFINETFQLVMKRMGEHTSRTSAKAIGAFFAEKGLLGRCDDGRNQRSMRGPSGSKVRVWPLRRKEAGVLETGERAKFSQQQVEPNVSRISYPGDEEIRREFGEDWGLMPN